VHAFLITCIRATCPAHLIPSYFIALMIFGEVYEVWSFSLCSFSPTSCHLILVSVNILLSTLFSDILNLCSLTQETDFHTCTKTFSKTILCILIFTFLYSRREDKRP
jgi:hypothetical protein